MTQPIPGWASESFWKKTAIWVTAGSFAILIILTFDSMAKITAGGPRVPSYKVINQKIDYRFDKDKQRYQPVIRFYSVKLLPKKRPKNWWIWAKRPFRPKIASIVIPCSETALIMRPI